MRDFRQDQAEALEAEYRRQSQEVREDGELPWETRERRIKYLSDKLRSELQRLGVHETGAA